jgi:hypothetical protein
MTADISEEPADSVCRVEVKVEEVISSEILVTTNSNVVSVVGGESEVAYSITNTCL